MALPQLSPGDALAEQARQLATAHAQQQALKEELQQASQLAYRNKVRAPTSADLQKGHADPAEQPDTCMFCTTFHSAADANASIHQMEADKLRAELEHAKAYRAKARQAKREAKLMQQELDRLRADTADAAAAASGES